MSADDLTAHGSRLTFDGSRPRLTAHGWRLTICGWRLTAHGWRLTAHGWRFFLTSWWPKSTAMHKFLILAIQMIIGLLAILLLGNFLVHFIFYVIDGEMGKFLTPIWLLLNGVTVMFCVGFSIVLKRGRVWVFFWKSTKMWECNTSTSFDNNCWG